ncbi:hypothetical protein ACTXT7_004179 [Hymenolepis weldensis]
MYRQTILRARANVTMHLGLTYDSSRNCDESPYKVTVCIGHKHDKCRIFGPHLFYVQAACAAYGPKEVIQFEVDSVEEPLRVDATIKETNGDKEFQLQPVTANLTFPRPIDAKTKNLKIAAEGYNLRILQFQFAYTCVADYFGDLCSVFCSSEAKEYRCSLTGEKICNPVRRFILRHCTASRAKKCIFKQEFEKNTKENSKMTGLRVTEAVPKGRKDSKLGYSFSNITVLILLNSDQTNVHSHSSQLSTVSEQRSCLPTSRIHQPDSNFGGYIKDNETGACIYDRCGSMPNYCLNGGRCVNKAQDEEDALDTTTMPICICPPTRMGARCEVFRVPPTPSTTTSSTTTATPTTISLPSTTTLASKLSGEIVAGKLINNSSIARYSNANADGMKATGSLQDHSNPDRLLKF